jgi:PAS domain S-box-containing protein
VDHSAVPSARRDSGWESERLIGGAIEAAPIGFSVLSESGRYVAVNRAACRLTGRTRADLLERTSEELSADPDRTRRAMDSTFRSGATAGLRQVQCADGSVLTVEYRLATASLGREPLIVAAWWPLETSGEEGEDGDPRSDAEGASLSRAQERVLGVAFQKAPIAVTVSDGDAAFLAVNDQACAITGFSRSELFDLGAWSIVLSPGPPTTGSLTDLRGIRSGEAEIRCRDGGTKRVGFRVATTVLGRERVRIAVWWET